MNSTTRLIRGKIPCSQTNIQIKRTLCAHSCPGRVCGIDAYVHNDTVIRVEGTESHPFSNGSLCARGAASRQHVYRKDRITAPLRRTGKRGSGHFEEITWEQAYRLIAERLGEIRQKEGPDAVAFLSGGSEWCAPFFHRFAYSFGSVNYASQHEIGQMPYSMAWKATAGTEVAPDYSHANTVFAFGFDPYRADHTMLNHLYAMKERGVKFLVADPRKTSASVKLANVHLQLRPGTDGALALGISKIILDRGWADLEFLKQSTYGLDEFSGYLEKFPLARVSSITGVPERDLVAAAELYATNGPAVIYQTRPTVLHSNGFQNARAIACLSAVTGNFDRPGGMVPVLSPTHDWVPEIYRRTRAYYLDRIPRDRPRKTLGTERFPLWGDLADTCQQTDLTRQILEETPYPIRGIVGMGFDAYLLPDPATTVKAMDKLDCFIGIDLFMTETAKLADILLPACTSFEREELRIYPGGHALYMSPAIVPLYHSKNEVTILAELSKALNLDDDLLGQGYDAGIRYILEDSGIDLDTVKEAGKPVRIPGAHPPVPGAYTRDGMDTASGKFEFYSQRVEKYWEMGLNPLPTYKNPLWDERADPEKYPFTLVCSLTRHSGLLKDTTADINAEDARLLGIWEGDPVEIVNPTGSLLARANPTLKLRRGEIFLYCGGSGQCSGSVVSADHLDPYTGVPGYKSNRCDVLLANTDKHRSGMPSDNPGIGESKGDRSISYR